MIASRKSDLIGAFASGLCLIHCVATPFLFVVQACSSTCCTSTPGWWQAIDYIFLIISFFAIGQSTRLTSQQWVKYALWSVWGVLLLIIVNEKMEWMRIAKEGIYIPALLLIVLHLYNRKYCRCEDGTCK